MEREARKAGLVARLIGWITRTIWGGGKTTAAVPDISSAVPLLFASRAITAAAPVKALIGLSEKAGVWVLAHRLRSVAKQNVPKALKGSRRARVSSAGKPTPKRQSRTLKRYKGERVASHVPLFSARLAATRCSRGPSEVVQLRTSGSVTLPIRTSGVERKAA